MHVRTLLKSEVMLKFWAALMNVLGAVMLGLVLLALLHIAPDVDVFWNIGAGVSALIAGAILGGLADIIILLRRNSGFAFPAGSSHDLDTPERGSGKQE